MPRRTSEYHSSSYNGLHMRAGRAAEDPVKMTMDAMLGRLAKHVGALHQENPALDPKALAKGARLRLKDEMAGLARKSAEARAAHDAG